MNFFFDGNQYSSIFSKNAIKKPELAKNWLATWRDVHGEIHHDIVHGATTNNQAEYGAVLMILRHLRNQTVHPWLQEAIIYGDSQLVIYQLTGQYQVKEPDLKSLWLEALNHIHVLKADYNVSVKLRWIRRELNNEALGLTKKIKIPSPGLEDSCPIASDVENP